MYIPHDNHIQQHILATFCTRTPLLWGVYIYIYIRICICTHTYICAYHIPHNNHTPQCRLTIFCTFTPQLRGVYKQYTYKHIYTSIHIYTHILYICIYHIPRDNHTQQHRLTTFYELTPQSRGVYIHIYIYTYIHIYTHIYKYTYSYMFSHPTTIILSSIA